MRTASTPSSNTRDDEAEDATVADIDDTEDEDEDEDDEDASGDDEEAMLLLEKKMGKRWLHRLYYSKREEKEKGLLREKTKIQIICNSTNTIKWRAAFWGGGKGALS